MKITLALSCFLLLLVIASCKESPTSTSLDAGPVIRPTVGSTYTYREHETDSTGKEIAGSSQMHTTTVVDTGMTYGGKSNLIFTREESGEGTYFTYEPDGDYGFIAEANDSMSTLWVMFPTGSRRTITETPIDTTIFGLRQQLTSATSYVATESITVPAGTYIAHHVRMTQTMTMTGPGVSITSTGTSDTWIAPSIGNIVRMATNGSQVPFGPTNGMVVELSSFVRK